MRRHYARRSVLAASVAGIFSMAGCAGLGGPPVEAAEVTITDMQTPDLGTNSVTLPIVIELRNSDSERALPAPTVEYIASIEDTELDTVRVEFPTIDPGTAETQSSDLTASYADLGSGIDDALSSGSFTVQITGTITSDGAQAEFSDTYQF